MKYSKGLGKTYKKIFWIYVIVYALSILFGFLASSNHLPLMDSTIFKYLLQFLAILFGLSITALFYHIKKSNDEKADFLEAYYDRMDIFTEKYSNLIKPLNFEQNDVEERDSQFSLGDESLHNLRELSKKRESYSKSVLNYYNTTKDQSKILRDVFIRDYYNEINKLIIKWWFFILLSYIIAIFVSIFALASHELGLEKYQSSFLFFSITMIIIAL